VDVPGGAFAPATAPQRDDHVVIAVEAVVVTALTAGE
jgi:hypothetical protein